MIELKNCPNCGGSLDDNGRCKYCDSKIYNLTDINIDFDTKDILVMKIKLNGQETLVNCYPTSVCMEIDPEFDSVFDCFGRVRYTKIRNNAKIRMELQSV